MAVITNDFKRMALRKLYDDASDVTNRYYIGIGKSEPWNDAETVPTPTGSIRDDRLARQGLQSIKSAANLSFVVSRYNWTSGTIYNAWDDNDLTVGANPYYIITEDNRVYMCVQEARNASGTQTASTVKPTHIDPLKAVKTADGYKWKYLYTVLSINASAYLSANFLPVRLADSTETGTGAEQYAVQDAAVRGQILGIKVINGGTGYSSTPTVTITGNGTGATATAYVTGGVVTHIFLDSDADSAMAMGRGYDFAGVTISGGSPTTAASARAVVGDIYGAGIGADPRNDLRSTSLMFNAKPDGIEEGNFYVGGQDFRQVVLIQDPVDSNGSAITSTTANASKYLVADDAAEAGGFANDALITGVSSNAQARFVANAADKIYIVQNDSTGYNAFTTGETVSGNAAGGGTQNATLLSGRLNYENTYQPNGKILYIDNRAAVVRDSGQTEDIKVVITI
jgi:hypothetical protein